MVIGFFDSGIGGLTVLHEALQHVRGADFLYYGDTENVPYGPKTKEQVRAHVFEGAEFLLSRGANILVIACNTATSAAVAQLRERYAVPIIGMEPAVKPAVENHKDKRVLVTATQLSLREDKLRQLIARLDCEDIVDLLPLPGLVTLAEDLVFDDAAVHAYLKDSFSGLNMGDYQTIVLGCTHFIYFKQAFQSLLGPDIDVIDGNAGTVKKLVSTMAAYPAPLTGNGAVTYFHSGREVTDAATLVKYGALLRRLDGAI